MKTLNLKKLSLSKIAVLATGLTAAVLVATMSPQAAQATPDEQTACTGCHTAGGAVTASPSSATPAASAAYTVAIVFTSTASGNSGYWISDASGTTSVTGGPAAGNTFSAAMTAPAAAGTYTYTVWATTAKPGQTSSTTYSITVGGTATTPPVTTTTPPVTDTTTPPVTTTTPPVTDTTAPAVTDTTTPAATDTTTATTPLVVAGVSVSAVIPVGAPNTGAGGSSNTTDAPMVGLGEQPCCSPAPERPRSFVAVARFDGPARAE